MRVFVNFYEKKWKKFKIDFNAIANAVVGKKYTDSEVSINLVDDTYIHELNKRYRNIDKPTNVLSFELGDDILLGDIYISLDTVKKEAENAGISVQEHTAHMVVHGIFHLLGYDHITSDQAIVMENKEIRVLKKLGYKNPYKEDVNVCDDTVCCPGTAGVTAWKKVKTYMQNNRWYRYCCFLLFGGIASLGFAPFYMWLFTLFGIGGAYLLSVCGKKSYFGPFLFGAAYSVGMFWWVLHSIYVVPELTKQFAVWTIPGLVGLGLAGGIIFSIPFYIVSCIREKSPYRPFLFSASWCVVLWLREWIFSGFPWNPVSNIFLEYSVISNSMSLFGALGLTFCIVGLVSVFCELIKKMSVNLLFVLFTFFIFSCVGLGIGYKNIMASNQDKNVNSPMIRLVQPAGTMIQKATYSRTQALQNAEYNLRHMFQLANVDGEPDLIVFPETAYPFVLLDGDSISLSKMLNKPVIIGANYFNKNKLYNAMIVTDRHGNVDNIYKKTHLVPFGEYRPFGNIIPTPGQLTPGDGPTKIIMQLNQNKIEFVPAICYEIIFSDSLINNVDIPDFIVNITNDNWFGNTPGTYQHLDMARRYAIESGLPIVRSNYSGISAVIGADGVIIAQLPVGQSGHIDARVWGQHNTLYRKIGCTNWLILILVWSTVCIIILQCFDKKQN